MYPNIETNIIILGDFFELIPGTGNVSTRTDGPYHYITDNDIFLTCDTFSDNMECVLLVNKGKYAGNTYYWRGGKFTADQNLYIIKKKDHVHIDYQYLYLYLTKNKDNIKKYLLNSDCNKVMSITHLLNMEIKHPIVTH